MNGGLTLKQLETLKRKAKARDERIDAFQAARQREGIPEQFELGPAA